jgi:plastocyanin
MLQKSYYIVLIIIIAISAFGCDFLNDDGNPDSNLVRIRDNSFDPPTLTVAVGRTVAWRNDGQNPHTVTSGSPTSSPGSRFDSGTLNSGGGFTFIFNETGNYPFFCRIHGASMSGTIQVR